MFSSMPNANRPGKIPGLQSFRGGDDGIRTHDPHVANVMLSQLSYIPTNRCAFRAKTYFARIERLCQMCETES